VGGIHGGGVGAALHRLHSDNMAVQHLAGGHQLSGDVFLNILIDLRLHALHQDGVPHRGLGGVDGAAAAAQELHAHDHRGNHDHQDHDQIHNIDLTKQSSLFVDHLLQPPRL